VNREEITMSRIAFVAVSLLALSACAPDTGGDLRKHTILHSPGAPSRITFGGVGAGSGPGAFEATFGEDWLPTFVADFGTTLNVLLYADDGAYRPFALKYEGNTVALGKLAARWREVFERAGAECYEGSCWWKDGDEELATLFVDQRWYGVAGVSVSLFR
jgi:hypothetical protein